MYLDDPDNDPESGGVPKPCPKCGKIDCKTVHQDGPDE